MHTKVSSLFCIICFCLCAISSALAQDIKDRYIVVFKDQVDNPKSAALDIGRAHGLQVSHVYSAAIKGFAATIPAAALAGVAKNPMVAYIEPDGIAHAEAQTLPSGVNRIDADLNAIAKIDGNDERVDVDIAILDTGVDLDHPDLNVVEAVNFTTYGPDDRYGHGTHVAGIAAALDNSFGVVGVAPGARIHSVKVLGDNNWGYWSWIIAGIDWVTQNAGSIEVANMSIIGEGRVDSLRTAIANSIAQGVVYVICAGNNSKDVYGVDGVFNTSDDQIPAAYQEVATISAIADSNDTFASFSNFSRSVVSGNPVISPGAAIDLAAPGVSIYSTYKDGSYASMSGTSMATPHVAGLAALYIAQNGRAQNAAGVAAVRQALIDIAEPQSVWRSTDTRDPDANHEGLADAEPIAPLNSHDVAIRAIVAPGSVIKGDNVQVDVNVENHGAFAETFNVILADDTGGNIIGTQQVILTTGASTTVSFSWDTTNTTYGAHTLTATAETVPGETDISDNSKSTVVTVEYAATDIAITAISATSPAVQGDIVKVNVTAQNVGNQDVSNDLQVTLTDDTDNVTIETKMISGGLAAGVSTNVTFSWNTTSANPGNHTLTATVETVPGETDLSDNSRSTIVTVEYAIIDIAITAINAPSPAIQGDVVTVNVMVENVGNQDVINTINVILIDGTDDVTIGSQMINGNLAASASTTLTFLWDTSHCSLGEHVLIVSHDFNDDNSGNNTNSSNVIVNGLSAGNPNDMYVWDISWQGINKGKSGLLDLNICVTIRRDSNANGIAESGDATVAGASVAMFITWAGKDGNFETPDDEYWNGKGLTDNNGQVTFVWKKASNGEFKSEVTDLVDATCVWNKGLDKDNPDFYTTTQLTAPTFISSKTQLLQNNPNPFNPETWIPFVLETTEEVIIRIYNSRGSLVRTLELGRKEAGAYLNKDRAAYWDGKNNYGERVSNGIYFYEMRAGSFIAVKKAMILK